MPLTDLVQLFDNFVGNRKHSRRNDQAKGPGGFEVYHELEFRGLHDRQLGRFFTPEYSADVDAGLTVRLDQAGAITNEATGSGEFAKLEHCWHCVMRCHRNKMIAPAGKERRSRDQYGACALLDKRLERRLEIVLVAGARDDK